jgi:hypothetical protein
MLKDNNIPYTEISCENAVEEITKIVLDSIK